MRSEEGRGRRPEIRSSLFALPCLLPHPPEHNRIRPAAAGQRLLAGFAGSAADGLTLFQKFEEKIERYPDNLRRAAVELAKDWRADRVLRRLEALLAIADRDQAFIVSGTGDLIEPDDGLIGIGSGGPYAVAAARALVAHSGLDARGIAGEAMRIAAGICIYTNEHVTIEAL